jgi:molybdopterin molybdotransferase
VRGVEGHLQGALEGIEPLEPLTVAVAEAIGCMLALDAVAPADFPFESISAGDVVLSAGTLIGPRQAALLAGAGLTQVLIRPRPRVVVVTVGGMLVAPGRPLPTAEHTVDCLQDMFSGAVREAGGVAYPVGPLPEDIDVITGTIEDQLVRADLVLVAGGLSAGPSGSVVDSLAKLGTVEFDEVALHPGEWQGLGRLGADGTPALMIPGDPMAAYVSFEVFVRPVLRRMLGYQRLLRPVVRARATQSFAAVPGRQHVTLGRLGVQDGRYIVTPVPGSGLRSLGSRADCLIVVPEDVVTVALDDAVPVLRVDRS